MNESKTKKIPIVVLNGFLGSGKTTLFRNLLSQSRKKNISVCAIVNDMSELDVDGQLISNAEMVEEDKTKMKSIHSCILSSKEGLKKLDFAINQLIMQQNPEFIIIETSGSCHPMPLVKYFRGHKSVKLTALFVLVDCLLMAHDFNYGESLIPLFQENLKNNKRDTINLLVEQILFCSHLILTKSDRIQKDKLELMASHIKDINPLVTSHPIVYGQLTFESLYEIKDYNFFNVEQLIKELDPLPEKSDRPYRIRTIVIKDDRPFHPKRLWEVCHNYLDEKIYRSKGFFWLASRDEHVLLWSQSSGDIGLEILGTWRIAILEDENNRLIDEEISFLQKKLSKETSLFGDRHCKLTVIGDKEKVDIFAEKLKTCFLSEEEVELWRNGFDFEDPWPQSFKKI